MIRPLSFVLASSTDTSRCRAKPFRETAIHPEISVEGTAEVRWNKPPAEAQSPAVRWAVLQALPRIVLKVTGLGSRRQDQQSPGFHLLLLCKAATTAATSSAIVSMCCTT